MPHRHKPLPVQMYIGIRDHFQARRSEWCLAFCMMGWGGILLLPEPVFTTSAWAPLAQLLSEPAWGQLAVWVGALRVIALTINGTFSGTVYSRWSPHVRAFAAGISAVIWFLLSWGLLTSGSATTGLAVYPTLFLIDVLNVWAATGDSKAMDRIVANNVPSKPVV